MIDAVPWLIIMSIAIGALSGIVGVLVIWNQRLNNELQKMATELHMLAQQQAAIASAINHISMGIHQAQCVISEHDRVLSEMIGEDDEQEGYPNGLH